MSDNSSSTGSSGSSTNSWTILSPEEVAVENVGPVDDGTESLGDAPSLSEETAGTTEETKPSDTETETVIETVLSEEGQQVCQETAPDASEGPLPSIPTLLSPSATCHAQSPLDSDLESQPPVIHDMVTSSPSDNDQLAAIPVDLGGPLRASFTEPHPSEAEAEVEAELSPPIPETPILDTPAPDSPPLPELSPPIPETPILDTPPIPDSPALETAPIPETPSLDALTETAPAPESPALESPLSSAQPYLSIPTESPAPTPSDPSTDISPSLESSAEPLSRAPESPLSETIGSEEAAEEEPVLEKEETELPEKVIEVGKEEGSPSSVDLGRGDTSTDDDGLRRRNVTAASLAAPRRTSDEEDEEEEVEFHLAERKEEKRGFSLNKCIVAALVLLCLGSLFLSDDSDLSELGDGEQNQEWLSRDPQEMKEVLDKLAQENQQISKLEAQLQSQKEELDSALKEGTAEVPEEGKGDLEVENSKMREELSSLPGLKEELETLRARVTELTQLTAANQDAPTPATSAPSTTPPPAGQPGKSNQSAAAAGAEGRQGPRDGGRLKEELQRQKALLEESRKRLEGMKKKEGGREGGHKKGVRDSLAEMQKRLTEQVERLGRRSQEAKKKPWENAAKYRNGKKGKDNGKDHWKREEEEKKERKHGKDKQNGGWKPHKQNSHRQSSRQDEWERKKDERRMDREKRKRERPWQTKTFKKNANHHHQHQHQHQHQPQPQDQPYQHDHTDFWKHQEEKLRHNVHPLVACRGIEDCANKEGLYPVELSEFEELLEGYLTKLEGAPPESKAKIRKLAAGFFEDGVFVHDRVMFSDFVEDVADVLEDVADMLEDEGQKEDDDALEEAMEEFEREALWKFAAAA